MSVASIFGFILVFLESAIVMWIKGYQSIDFGGISPFVSVWAMNFFWVFSILTHIKQWYMQRENQEDEYASNDH
ncbi:hypothetical protein [Bacillus massilinigeriensis]|uniref:hypothetical protein n=1 Tax=Bacillus mediterraneensis TaxID=1805474 RepID=UPI001F1BC88B|nr:hypothetical protein [Bacillus mediterraneensis]